MKTLKTIFAITLLSSCEERKDEIASADEPVQVILSDINQNGTSGFISVSGKTEALNSANISTRMMGYVTYLNVKIGQKVNKGQNLVSINNSDLQAKKFQVEASVEQASVTYNNAKKDFERYQSLFKQNSATQKEFDDINMKYEIAKAAKEGALQMRNEVMAQFNYSDVTAPFSGVITNTFVKEGDLATPGMPLISIEGESVMQVLAMIPESDISFIKNNMEVRIFLKSLNKELYGKVTELSTSSKNTGGQYPVKITFDKPDKDILSGMIVNIRFPVTKQQQLKASPEILL